MLGKFKTEIHLSADLQASPPYIFAAKPLPLCLLPWERRCVEKSGILVSQPSPLGKGDRVAVDRVLS